MKRLAIAFALASLAASVGPAGAQAAAAAQAQVRAQVAQTRANRFKLAHAIEDVDNQIALLRANIAALETKRATLTRTKNDYDRAIEVAKTPGAISPQDADQRREAWQVAQAQVKKALENVYQIRVSFGLPAKPKEGGDLSQVSPDLDQNYSTVRQALADLVQARPHSTSFPPRTMRPRNKSSQNSTASTQKGTSIASMRESGATRPSSSRPRPNSSKAAAIWTRPC